MNRLSQSSIGSLNVFEDARLVGVAGMARQQLLRLLAAVAAEIGVQQIDHRPEMAAFLDIDLEEAAKVVERGADVAEQALLLDRRGLGVALRHDQAAQGRAMLARHLLPRPAGRGSRRSRSCAPASRRRGKCPSDNRASSPRRRSPSLWNRRWSRCADRRRRPGNRSGPRSFHQVEEFRLPMLERALQRAVGAEIDVVGNALGVGNAHGQILSQSNWPRLPEPKRLRAPFSPTALGRLKIQFCHADRRPKIFVSRSPRRRSAGSPPCRSARRATAPRAPRPRGGSRPPSRDRRARR